MDFAALIKKSFSFAWHNRVLWLFGFLSGGAGTAGYFNPSGFTLPGSTETSKTEVNGAAKVLGVSDSNFGSIAPETWLLIILGIVAIALIILLILIFITNWAASALVYSILRRNQERPNFAVGASAGLTYWWKFFLLGLLLGFFILLFVLMLAIPVILLFLSGARPLAIVSLILAIIVFIIFIFIVAAAGSLIITIAQRLIVHKNVGVIESVRLSGGLIKKYLGESLLTFVVAIGLNFAAGFAAILVILPIVAVVGLIFFIGIATGLNIWPGLIAIVPALILLFALGGFWNAFQATYWTLFYEHLISKEGW